MADKIVCVHIGARAHYLLPKAVEDKGKLAWLVTDTWIASSAIRRKLKQSANVVLKSLAGRFTPDIPSKKVFSFGITFLLFEIYLRLAYKNVWQQIIARNQYFEKKAARFLKSNRDYNAILGTSYTSLEVFRMAKKQETKKVLFQIDPAIEEEMIVDNITQLYKDECPTTWQKAPESYWSEWKEECSLADIILVNSDWSRDAIVKHGVSPEKIKVISLPIEITEENIDFKKSYPEQFSKARPLYCLYLGTLTLRKGIHIVLDVAKQLENYPIRFILIGNSELNIDFEQYKNVSYQGVVSREETKRFYQQADIFLFPTLSDGFGLTQLEAMSWKLPVMASQYCGKVVSDKVDGFILQNNTPDEMVAILHLCLQQPSLLQTLSEQSFETAKSHSVKNFADRLMQCFE